MKKVSVKVATIIAVTFVGLSAMSCNNGENNNSQEGETSEMNTSNKMDDSQQNEGAISAIIKPYMALKNALETDDNEAAQNAGKLTMNAFKDFDISGYDTKDQKTLKDIIDDATENAEHISESPIKHQREHFKILSQDVIDMVAITGTDSKMYQMSCPMYQGGSLWLSMEKEVKNPYYGSKMSGCGEVQKEIN